MKKEKKENIMYNICVGLSLLDKDLKYGDHLCKLAIHYKWTYVLQNIAENDVSLKYAKRIIKCVEKHKLKNNGNIGMNIAIHPIVRNDKKKIFKKQVNEYLEYICNV